MQIFNTLTRQKEEFVPQVPGEYRIYVCGPTVYNYIHIGNARALCVFDTLRRYLEFRGYKVFYVQNFTDVDDKIIKKANELGKTAHEVSENAIREYFTDADGLNVRRADVHPKVTENMDKYELGIAVQKVYDFLWDELCDWYIEMAKVRLWKAEENPADANAALWTLTHVLSEALKLLHPYMPFITEEIYCTLLPEEESIMISDWPVYKDEMNFADAEKAVASFQEVVRGIRNTRNEMNVPQNRKTNIYIVGKDAESCARFESCKRSFTNLAFAKEIHVQQDKSGIPDDAVSTVIPDAVIYIPFAELVDIDKEIERLQKEEKKLNGEIARCNGMLNNEKFTSKAPQAKIDEEKAKLEKYTQMMEQVRERLAALK